MPYLPLARKYRPQTFNDVVGQNAVMVGLQHALTANTLSCAYLLTGTRGVGKTTLARLIAKAVNCEHGISFHACQHCNSCTTIVAGINPDVYEVDGASKTKVEDIRSLLENTQFMPLSSRFKVYIIDEVHMLSNHAFNALLKTLEEPPQHVLFILATTELEKIPATIRSRCMHYALLPFSDQQILERCQTILHQENIPYDDSLRYVAHAGKGSMRDALTLLEQIIHIGQGTVSEQGVHQLLGNIPNHVFDAWVEDLLSGDTTRLVGSLDALAATQPPCKALLEKLLETWYTRTTETINSQDACNFIALYDITLTSIDQLACAPDTTLHLQMVWLKLWHAVHHRHTSRVIVRHQRSPVRAASEPTPAVSQIPVPEATTQHDTPCPVPSKTTQWSNTADYKTWLAGNTLIKGMMREALKHLDVHSVTLSPTIVYHFHYPKNQEVLFHTVAQKKIIAFLLEHVTADNILLSASNNTSPEVSPPATQPQSQQRITPTEDSCLRKLGFPPLPS